MRMREVALVTAISLVVAACGQLGIAPPATPPLGPGVSVHADPSGDAGASPTFDVVELMTARGASDLQVRIWTVPDPVLSAPGTAPSTAQFSGGIGFNIDLNSATGSSFVAPCGGGQGFERFIDLTVRNASGTYNVLNAATLAVTGTATVSQDGPRVTFTASFAALGTATGRTDVNALAGVGGPLTFAGKDCAPDAGQALPSRTRTPGEHPLLW